MESGYSSHANFTRAFKETFGMTPEDYRMHRPTLNTFIKPEISMYYTVIDVPGEAWNKFHTFKNKSDGLFRNDVELGVSHSPDPPNDIFKYFAGGLIYETTTENPENTDMSFYSLQPGDYVVCTIEADSFEFLVSNALYQSIKYLHEIWLPKNNLSSGPFDAEKYFKDNADVHRMEYWIPVKQNG